MNCKSDPVEVEDSDDDVSKSSKVSTTEIQVIRSKIKSNAQKCKEYRERKKLGDVRLPKNSAQRSDECLEKDQLQEIKKPKTDAQRSKEYRERQKMKKQIELQQKNTDHPQSTSTRTSAEYMKEYRRKVKLKNQSIRLDALIRKDHSDVSNVQNSNCTIFNAGRHNIADNMVDKSEDRADAAEAETRECGTYKNVQKQQYLSEPAEPSEIEDKYDILCNYIASNLRQLQTNQLIFVERIINKALYEGRMGNLNNTSQLVLNTQTYVNGRPDEGMWSKDPEIIVKKKYVGRVKVEKEDELGGASEYKDEMRDQDISVEMRLCF